MKKLTDILKNTPVREVCGDTAAAIGGLVYDSRAVKPGDCFFAVPGTQSDGHDYIPMAVEKGAAAIVCERRASLMFSSGTRRGPWPIWPRRSTTTRAAS